MFQQIQFNYNVILTNAEGYADPTAASVLIAEARAEISKRKTAKNLKEMEAKHKPTYKLAWSRKTA